MKRTILADDVYGKKHKIPAHAFKIRASAYGAVIKNGKILLSLQWGRYVFPGGGINSDETIEEGLKREIWEETGFRSKPLKLLTASTSFFKATEPHSLWNNVVLFYACKPISGKISTKHFDEVEKKFAKAAEWIPLKDLKKIKFHNWIVKTGVLKIIQSEYGA